MTPNRVISFIAICVTVIQGQEVFFGGKRFVCRPSADGKDRRCCSTEFKQSTSTSQCIDLVPIPVSAKESAESDPSALKPLSFPLRHPNPGFRFQPRFNPKHSLPNAKFSGFQSFSQPFGGQALGRNLFGGGARRNFPRGPAFVGGNFLGNSFNQPRRPPALPPPGANLGGCGLPRCRQNFNSPCGTPNCPQHNQRPRIFNRQSFTRQLFPTNQRTIPRQNPQIQWQNTGLRRPQPTNQLRNFNFRPRNTNNGRPPLLSSPGTALLRQINPPKITNNGFPPQKPNGQLPWTNPPPRQRLPAPGPFVTQPLPKVLFPKNPGPTNPPLLPIEPSAPLVPRPPIAPANVQPPPEEIEEYYEITEEPETDPPILPLKLEKPKIDVKAIPAPRIIPKQETIEITPKPPKPWELPRVIKTTRRIIPTTRSTPKPTTRRTTKPTTRPTSTPAPPDLSNFPTPRPFIIVKETEKPKVVTPDDGHNLPWPPRVLPGRVPCRRPWGCSRRNVLTTRRPKIIRPRTNPTRTPSTFRTRSRFSRTSPKPVSTRRPTPRKTLAPQTQKPTTRRQRRTFAPRTPKPTTSRPRPPVLLEFPEFPTPPRDTKCFLDLMFIIDASGSVKKTFQSELDLAARTVDTLTLGEKGAKVALIKFAGPRKARVELGFGEKLEKEAMKKKIVSARHISGITETAEALDLASKEFSKDRGSRIGIVKPVAILFTDGFSSTDPVPAAERLRNKGVVLFALAIDKPRDEKELERMTGNPARVFTDQTFSEFKKALADLTHDCGE